MIRPSCVRRLGAAALALWFGIFMAESVMLGACPMHGGGEGGAAHAEMSAVPHAAMSAAAHAQVMAATPASTAGAHLHHTAAPSGDDAEAPKTPSPCDCLAQCLGGAVVAVVPPLLTLDVSVVQAASATAVPAERAPRSLAPHRLPFAIPPPAGVRAA